MDPVRGWWALGSIAGMLAGWACGSGAFTCGDDEACRGDSPGGACVEGYCAFPSDVCSSGLQYGQYAGGLAGTCVPVSDSDGASSSTGPGESSLGATTRVDDTTLDGLDSSSDGPPGGDVELRDDALRGEFGSGDMQGVVWADDRLTLVANETQGTFLSRVFDAGASATWHSVQWLPDGPYGKPLPNGGAAESGYLEGGVDMADNVLLMHFDEAGEWGDGVGVLDDSGAGSHGAVVTDGQPLGLVPGVIGTALDDDADGRISIPTARAPALAFGSSDFTWALWVRMDSPCTSNHVYMGVDDADTGFNLGPHLWLGCTDDPWDECPGNVGSPRAGGVLRSIHSNQSDGGFFCSQSAIDGDVWHHLVVVKQGHARSTLRAFVDGELEYEGSAQFAVPIQYPNDPDFTIGAFSRGTYPAEGVYDEAAVWTRALGADEVAAVHARGVRTLRVSVRACDEPECADDPPFGPMLVDPPQVLEPGTTHELEDVVIGRYVQYRLELGGDGVGAGPALRSVVVRGVR